MASSFRVRLNRSLQNFRQETRKTLTFNHLDFNPKHPVTIAKLCSPADLDNFVTGCDGDFGGYSKVKLDLDESGKGRFSGHLSDKVNSRMYLDGRKVERSGFAGFRTRLRPSLFGQLKWDVTQYSFLRLRLKNSGDAMRYFVNIQAEEAMETNVYQHRLWLPSVGKWEDVLIPFEEFTYTNAAKGEGATSAFDSSNPTSAATLAPNLDRNMVPQDRILTFGISVLGPGQGPFELGLESIDAVNVHENVDLETKRDHEKESSTSSPSTSSSSSTTGTTKDDPEGVSAADALERARQRAGEPLHNPEPAR